MRNLAKTYMSAQRGKHFSETLGKIHVLITQTRNNHHEIAARHAGKMVISSFCHG